MAVEPISQFFTKFSRYPGNNKQWWVARADIDDPAAVPPVKAGDFLPELLDKLFSGNNRAPRGHFVLNAFYKDRATTSGVGGIPLEVINERPASICFFAGRAWYGCNSTVYFSQVLTDRYKAGLCYQEADPTAEDISDLIATDGGVVPIPEISKIVRMIPHGGGVIVLATNGVWNITGTDSGFSALDISVNKISPVGCRSPMSVVETEAGVFWWSDIGIMGMQEKLGMYGPIPGSFDRTNITEETIQTLFNDIDEDAKREVKGVFDARNNRILWLYRDDGVVSTQYNRVLIFDLTLGAFYPWAFSSLASNSPVTKGIYISERLTVSPDAELVQVGGTQVQVGGEDVEVEVEGVNNYPSAVEFLAFRGSSGRFCMVHGEDFVDWKTADGTGVPYESFVETGYELFDDAMRRKNITYLFTYLKQTETTWVDGDPPTTDHPSSCYLQVKWDWANSEKSNKWSTPVQVYRPGRRFITMDAGDYDTGYPIVVTKNKVRGNGKSIQFRYSTDEPGRDFDLHGWSIAVTGDTVP